MKPTITEIKQNTSKFLLIEHSLISENETSTLSQIVVDGFKCFALEDDADAIKQHGDTRIPAGLYEIERRTVGSFFEQYKRKFGHKYSIWIKDIPNYEYVLYHIGNTKKDTMGCPLLGTKYAGGGAVPFTVSESTKAYLQFYLKLDAAFASGKRVFTNITR